MKSRKLVVAFAVGTALTLSGCSKGSSTTAAGVTAPTSASTSRPAASSPTASATPPPAPSQSAVPTSLDPCQLVPAQEASKLAGTSFGPGKETSESNAKQCVYGAQTLNVFTVEVAQAPSVAAAQAAKAAFLKDLQSKVNQQTSSNVNLKVTKLPNLADGAVVAHATASFSGQTIGVSSIGVLRGTIFFGFSDLVLGHAPPSNDALEAEAQTVLGRLP